MKPLIVITGTASVSANEKPVFDALNGLTIGPKSYFSLNESFKQAPKAARNAVKEDSYSYMASLLYEGAVTLGMTTGERQLHEWLPDYVRPGFDVFAQPDGNDLTLYNPTKYSVNLQISYAGDKPALRFEAEGDVKWDIQQATVRQTSYAPERMVVEDASAAVGSVKTQSEGEPGMLVEVRTGGKTVSRDFYLPQPSVIVQGPASPDNAETQAGQGDGIVDVGTTE
ncbi:VanW family protein [Cohnella yongneupensis]|uniref:VanW family protein n=1 Tax=Cohnella yongneupensis TaxID=425006 RepID=A0ABW0R5Y6_9BACL